MMQNSRGGKLGNAGKIIFSQIFIRIQTAPCQNSVLDTGSQKVAETYLQIQIIQFL